MGCPSCKKSDHRKGAKYCDQCGSLLDPEETGETLRIYPVALKALVKVGEGLQYLGNHLLEKKVPKE